MTSQRIAPFALPLAALAIAFAGAAQAQSTTTQPSAAAPTAGNAPARSAGSKRMYDAESFSVIPYSTNGYIGLNVGKPDWSLPCGGGPFGCDESNTAFNLYTGGMFNQHFGAEIGYVDFGDFKRGGGRTSAAGLNLSLEGHLPLGGVNLYAKIGTIYGRTKTSANPLSTLATGKRSGWEGSYGVGVGFDLSPRSMVVLEWNRYDLNFSDVGKRDITTTSIGYVHRF